MSVELPRSLLAATDSPSTSAVPRERSLSTRPSAPNKLVKREVTWLIKHRDPELYRLRIAGEAIHATGNHPFWVKGRGWVEVRDLAPGCDCDWPGPAWLV